MGVGVRVGVRGPAAPVLAGQSSTFHSSTGHHVALGMPTLCKAASPRNKGTRLSPFSAVHGSAAFRTRVEISR